MRSALAKLPTVFPKRLKTNKAKADRTLKPLTYPRGEELLYQKELMDIVRALEDGINARVVERLPRLVRSADRTFGRAQRTDSLDDVLRRIFALIRRDFRVTIGEARRIAMRMLDTVNVQQANEFAASYGDILSLNPLIGQEKWFLDAFRIATEENAQLIRSIPEQSIDRVQVIVSEALLAGKRAEAIAEEIFTQFGVTENRALLIAQDQVGKWFGSLQQLRQQEAGIEEYEWSTSGDERVRPSHRVLDGKTFKWTDPPVVASNGRRAHPGGDVRCRCIAAPIIPGWEEDE